MADISLLQPQCQTPSLSLSLSLSLQHLSLWYPSASDDWKSPFVCFPNPWLYKYHLIRLSNEARAGSAGSAQPLNERCYPQVTTGTGAATGPGASAMLRKVRAASKLQPAHGHFSHKYTWHTPKLPPTRSCHGVFISPRLPGCSLTFSKSSTLHLGTPKTHLGHF